MIAADLRTLLIESGRSQKWLAGQLGVAANTVNGWATGRLPIPATRDDAIRGLLSTTCPRCGAAIGSGT